MKIPKKPDWENICGSLSPGEASLLDKHWKKEIQPMIDAIEKGTAVYNFEEVWHPCKTAYGTEEPRRKALLIDVQEIEKDSFEKLVRDSIYTQVTRKEFNERAKRLLEGGE